MKTVMTALSLMMLSMSAAVLADDAAPILSLGDNMKKIAGLVKAIAGAVNDTSKNAASAAEADQLAAVFGAVLNQVPDSIAALSADQQAAALADFKSMIQEEIDDSKALEKAFQANDNAAASATLAQMNALKKEGHGKYAN